MTTSSICTIGDEILIGQVVDTNSSRISRALGELGIRTSRMLSIGDCREDIINNLRKELSQSDIVIVTGGLGPTKDDITKDALRELSGSQGYYEHPGQLAKVHEILRSRGLDVLDINRAQALVPDRAEVIVNRLGTAPIMVFRLEGGKTLYALPGVPFEAVGALPDVLADIQAHYPLEKIRHRNIMVYGIAESALSKKIEAWETALPADMHLAYLPDPLTGIRLRLSQFGGGEDGDQALEAQIGALKALLGALVYSDQDDRLECVVGRLLKAAGQTLSAAESCTGGEIAHMLTGVPGSSAYFLGSVTSYAIAVKESVLGVPAETIDRFGVVSSEVAAAMAEGVRRLTGSDWSVATTGLAGPDGDGVNPVGTVWIAVASKVGTVTAMRQYKNDRLHNIERFAASALDLLRLEIQKQLNR
ncbi:MAG: CinA family nicotinamide mononucleotide deamidase-related protein [Bacteroidota bacterium]|nr:CinA family nicotinamide mononucleotide deamidase-related protein [Bacteroidota bacterium]